MHKKYICRTVTVFALLLLAMGAQAQQAAIVRGRVVFGKSGQPLPGVTITEKNRENRLVNGTITDINGNYQIEIADKADTLYFSMIGLRTVARAIGSQQTINVTMQDDNKMMKEVLVTGKKRVETNAGGFLDITQREQTAAITRIEMKELEEIPATSIDQVLEGQVSGLLISMNSGDPGSGSSIQIRGAASLGLGSKPLIVVDNVPFKTDGAVVDVNNPEGLSELVNISPSDIESIDVLKDAAATALWGSDGANGVIVIKTKRGDNMTPRVNITSMATAKYPQRPLPLLNGDQYKTMILEAYQARFGTNIDLTTSVIRNLFLEQGSLDYENYNNNTYWPDAANMKRGFGQNYTGSIIGGGESAKYNISLGYLNETGPSIGTSFRRVNGRFNFDYKISDKLLFTSDLSYADDEKKSNYENIGAIALRKAPVLPVYNQDEYGNSLPGYFFPGLNGFQNDIRNPIAIANLAKSTAAGKRLDGKISVRYSPITGLQINSLVATTYQSLTSAGFLPHSATGADYYRQNNIYTIVNGQVNSASVSPRSAFSTYVKNDFMYNRTLGQHRLMAGLYNIYQDNSSRSISLAATNTPSEYLSTPFSSDILNTISSGRSLGRDLSVVGQLYYFFGDRYSVSGSLRRQGNSAFGRRNRWGSFPSVSGFWRPTAEPLLLGKTGVMDDLKFRGSWGITGRAPGISAANAFTFSANAPFIDIQGITADNIELVNLRWEKSTSVNLGMDLSLWKGRLSFTGDVSESTTRDMILTVPISPTSGFETITENFGSMRGRVLEGAVTGIPISTSKWKLTGSFNISTTRSTILELPGNGPVIRDNVIGNGLYMTMVNVGDAFGTIYGLKSLGVYATDEDAFLKVSSPEGDVFVKDFNGNKIPVRWMTQNGQAFTGGDAHYADLNNDGIINKSDVTAIGNATPRYFGGYMFRLNYNKAWEVFANFTYQYDFDIVNMAKIHTSNMYTNNNQSQAVMRRWRKQGDVTDIPRALYGAGYNWAGSDRFVEDGSYIKFNQLSLAYNLKGSQLLRLKLRSAKVAMTVSNVYTLTRYSGVDPSVSANRNDPFSFGRDNALTPMPITYTLGCWVNF